MQTLNINLLKANAIMSDIENQTTVSKCLLLDNEEFIQTFVSAINKNQSIEEITATLMDFVANNY
jgi:hypothetical protein